MKKRLRNLTRNPPVWAKCLGRENVILASRINIPRNISGVRFPSRLTATESNKILQRVRPVFKDTNLEEYSVNEMDQFDASFFWERGLSNGTTDNTSHGKSIFMDSQEFRMVMINELDHLCIIAAHPGLSLNQSLEEATELEHKINQQFSFAKNKKDGFVTSWVDMCGNGARLSIIIFVPGITLEARERLQQAVEEYKLNFSGPFGINPIEENPLLGGSIMQLSVHSHTEQETAHKLDLLKDFAHYITDLEIKSRKNLNQDSMDLIGKLWGMLIHGASTTEDEAMVALELGLLGAWAGMIDKFNIPIIQKMFYLSLNGHLMSTVANPEVYESTLDTIRSNFIQKSITGTVTNV